MKTLFPLLLFYLTDYFQTKFQDSSVWLRRDVTLCLCGSGPGAGRAGEEQRQAAAGYVALRQQPACSPPPAAMLTAEAAAGLLPHQCCHRGMDPEGTFTRPNTALGAFSTVWSSVG